MSIQLEFTPNAPEGLVFQGEINLGGACLTFHSMDSSSAVISDCPDDKLSLGLAALAGLLQVKVTVVGGDTFSAQPEQSAGAADTPIVDFKDNVFELDIEDSLGLPVNPSAGLAEVIPINSRSIKVNPAVCLWETLFAKPEPVSNLTAWASSRDSDAFIYIPNDLSKPEGSQESYLKNAEFTQIMLFAYQEACSWKKVDPEIMLADGQGPFSVRSLDPMSGIQHNVVGGKVARLANSTLVGEDNDLIHPFLSVLRSMDNDDFTSQAAHLTVLAKQKLTLTGESSLVTNYTVVSNLCNYIESEFVRDGSFMVGNSIVLNAVLFTLRQMVIQDLILHSSKEHFMACMYRAQLEPFAKELGRAYDEACSCR